MISLRSDSGPPALYIRAVEASYLPVLLASFSVVFQNELYFQQGEIYQHWIQIGELSCNSLGSKFPGE